MREAVSLARVNNAELNVLAIVPNAGSFTTVELTGPMDVQGAVQSRVQEAVEAVSKELLEDGINVKTNIRQGDPADEIIAKTGVKVKYKVGTMVELPRACVAAGELAADAEFFSFGTNDLTQTTWGFSRDDVEAEFFATYLDKGIFTVSPFESLDVDGVGALVKIAVDKGRTTRPDLKIGVCGEHGGDPESIKFFHAAGLDYVSCSPFRVPIARLEAGRAALSAASSDTR